MCLWATQQAPPAPKLRPFILLLSGSSCLCYPGAAARACAGIDMSVFGLTRQERPPAGATAQHAGPRPARAPLARAGVRGRHLSEDLATWSELTTRLQQSGSCKYNVASPVPANAPIAFALAGWWSSINKDGGLTFLGCVRPTPAQLVEHIRYASMPFLVLPAYWNATAAGVARREILSAAGQCTVSAEGKDQRTFGANKMGNGRGRLIAPSAAAFVKDTYPYP